MTPDISAHNILDGITGEIDREASFADITVDLSNENNKFSNFLKIFPKEVPVYEWTSWKSIGEIDIERARYLLSTDEVLEEMLNKIN